MTIFINDLFNFFRIHPVLGDVLEIVFVPLGFEDSKLHRQRLSQ
jgi:hypothetical protein